MGNYTDAERNSIIGWCNRLGTDTIYDIKSDRNPLYNCIGYAMGTKHVFVALGRPDGLAWCWWPPTVPFDENPSSLVEAFKYFGFEETTIPSVELGYDKVALYEKAGKWTHAARIETHVQYHSKLGIEYDIIHSPGDVFHDVEYGDVFTYMKRPVFNRYITNQRMPTLGTALWNGIRLSVLIDHGKAIAVMRVR